jgi:hypothetical protein
MKTILELKELCESSEILEAELTKEEILMVNCNEMSIKDSLVFIKKYGEVLATRATNDIDKITKDWGWDV